MGDHKTCSASVKRCLIVYDKNNIQHVHCAHFCVYILACLRCADDQISAKIDVLVQIYSI